MYGTLVRIRGLGGTRETAETALCGGDTVYHLCTFKNGESEIIEMKVGCVESCGVLRNNKGVCEIWNVYAETDYTKGYFKFSDFGEIVFLTQELAEAALKDWKEVRKNETN